MILLYHRVDEIKYMKKVKLEKRIYADIDNEQIEFADGRKGVGISKTDYMIDFEGKEILLTEGDYIYLYMDAGADASGEVEYVFAEGYVYINPCYPYKTPCKWCCKFAGHILYRSEYNKLF